MLHYTNNYTAEEMDRDPAGQAARPLSKKLTNLSTSTSAAETTLESKRVKVAQLELHVTTTRKDAEGTRQSTAVSVLCEYFRTITKERTIKRVAAAVSALVDKGEDAAVTLYSRRGKPLVRLSTQQQSGRALKETALYSPETHPADLIRLIANGNASRIIIKSKGQLAEIAPIAERLGIEKIFVPRHLLKHAPKLKVIEPIGSAIGMRIGVKQDNPASEKTTKPAALNPLKNTANTVATNSYWQTFSMPALSSLITKTAVPAAAPATAKPANEVIDLGLEKARHLMARLAESIDADIRENLKNKNGLRASLMNLGRSVGTIRAEQPELHILREEKDGVKPAARRRQNEVLVLNTEDLQMRFPARNDNDAASTPAAQGILAA